MDDTNPKISFIPKGSLVREESFLERPRPRSMAVVVAVILVIVSGGSYTGLYFYNDSFEKDIVSMTGKISAIQQKFSNAPEVAEAQLFSSRANVAIELLRAHTVLSPIFTFLSKNTVESVQYDKFSFEKSADGSKILLTGEAPNYAALAYQGDVLRSKAELLNFSIKNVSLTQFGAVSFTLALTFTPDYLLYIKSLAAVNEKYLFAKETATTTYDTTDKVSISSIFSQQADGATATSTTKTLSENAGTTTAVVVATRTEVVVPAEKPSKFRSLWSLWLKFKFW